MIDRRFKETRGNWESPPLVSCSSIYFSSLTLAAASAIQFCNFALIPLFTGALALQHQLTAINLLWNAEKTWTQRQEEAKVMAKIKW